MVLSLSKISFMKKIFFLFVFLPIVVFCQEDFTFKDISGKWLEASRTDKNNTVIQFQDTIYVEIREDEFMLVRPKIGKTYFGDAEIKDNKIYLQNEQFQIESAEKNILKLKHGKYTHRFVRFEQTPDMPAQRISHQDDKPNEIKTTTKSLIGKWTVYKKTDEQFSVKKYYFKILDIQEVNLDNLLSGSLTLHNMDKQKTTPFTIFVQGVEMNMTVGEDMYKIQLLRNNGNEMIFRIGSATYYLKRFSEQ